MVTGCPQGERAAGCAAGLMGLSTGTRVPLQHRQAKQFYCLCPQPPSEVIFQLHLKGWDTIELSICLFLLNGIVTARPQETETQHNYHNQAAAKPLTAQDTSLLSCGESYCHLRQCIPEMSLVVNRAFPGQTWAGFLLPRRTTHTQGRCQQGKVWVSYFQIHSYCLFHYKQPQVLILVHFIPHKS